MSGIKVVDDDIPEELPLVAQLIQANLNAAHATGNRLIESLMSQVADLNAEVKAIRAGVMRTLNGDFMPSAAAIERALWPSSEFVDLFRKGES